MVCSTETHGPTDAHKAKGWRGGSVVDAPCWDSVCHDLLTFTPLARSKGSRGRVTLFFIIYFGFFFKWIFQIKEHPKLLLLDLYSVCYLNILKWSDIDITDQTTRLIGVPLYQNINHCIYSIHDFYYTNKGGFKRLCKTYFSSFFI